MISKSVTLNRRCSLIIPQSHLSSSSSVHRHLLQFLSSGAFVSSHQKFTTRRVQTSNDICNISKAWTRSHQHDEDRAFLFCFMCLSAFCSSFTTNTHASLFSCSFMWIASATLTIFTWICPHSFKTHWKQKQLIIGLSVRCSCSQSCWFPLVVSTCSWRLSVHSWEN